MLTEAHTGRIEASQVPLKALLILDYVFVKSEAKPCLLLIVTVLPNLSTEQFGGCLLADVIQCDDSDAVVE